MPACSPASSNWPCRTGASSAPEDIVALTRITFYDLELTNGALVHHRTEKREALAQDTEKMRGLFAAT